MRYAWKKIRRGCFYLALFCLLVACGEAVSPEEIREAACKPKACWNVDNSNPVRVNDDPLSDRTVSGQVSGWQFFTQIGVTYTVQARASNGSIHTYVSTNSVINFDTNKLNDFYSNDNLTFTATANVYFVAVKDNDNVKGSDYSIRVYSNEENLNPLPGTTLLYLNGVPESGSLIRKEGKRYMFSAFRGRDYIIHVDVEKGSTNTFMSFIPSVNEGVYDLADFYSNDDIKFRATKTATYYIAVADRGNTIGSDFSIMVVEQPMNP